MAKRRFCHTLFVWLSQWAKKTPMTEMKVMCLKTSNLSLPSRTIIHVSRNTFAPFISNRVSPKYNQVKRVLDRDKKLSFLIGDKGCVASVSGHILIRYAQRIYSGGRYSLKFVLPKEYVAKEYPCDNADEIGNE